MADQNTALAVDTSPFASDITITMEGRSFHPDMNLACEILLFEVRSLKAEVAAIDAREHRAEALE